MEMADRDVEREGKSGVVSAGILEISTKANSRAFTVISSSPPHVKIASSGTGRVGRRIASLSAVPRIPTNIFPKQLDCVESEKDRQIERIRVRQAGEAERKRRGERVHDGDALCLGQWYRVELVPAKGWRIPATPPHISSYLFLLPVYDAPSSAERRERIGERRKEEEEEGGGKGEEMVCQYSLCLRRKRRDEGGKKEGKMVAKRNGGNTRVESARYARHARIYSYERESARV